MDSSETTLTNLPQAIQAQAASKGDPTNKDPFPGLDGGKISDAELYAYVFALLVTAMNVRQETVKTLAKQLQLNAAAQNKLNEENKNIHFSQIPSKGPDGKPVGQATINRVQAANEQYTKERQDIQNQLITLRQTAQVQMTSTNTNVNMVEQDASEDSGWLKTLNTIFKVINQITQSP